MLKLVVFDWDGTIADSIGKIILCKYYLAKKYNLAEPKKETIRQVLGLDFHTALKRCFVDADDNQRRLLADEFQKLMLEPQYQAALFPNAIDVVTRLKKRGIKVAIATSKSRVELNNALVHHGLADMFDIVCCGEEYGGKPNPNMLNHIINKTNTQRNESVMVGDTSTDVEFAHNAGIRIIGVTFGAHTKKQLLAANCDFIINEWNAFDMVVDKVCHLNST